MGFFNDIQRKKFFPRHVENFPTPCVWRGVKEIYSWQ